MADEPIVFQYRWRGQEIPDTITVGFSSPLTVQPDGLITVPAAFKEEFEHVYRDRVDPVADQHERASNRVAEIQATQDDARTKTALAEYAVGADPIATTSAPVIPEMGAVTHPEPADGEV